MGDFAVIAKAIRWLISLRVTILKKVPQFLMTRAVHVAIPAWFSETVAMVSFMVVQGFLTVKEQEITFNLSTKE